MAAPNRSKTKIHPRSVQKKKSKFPLLAAVLGGVCLFIVAAWVLNSKNAGLEPSAPPADSQSAGSKDVSADKKRDFRNLIGRWVRTDGGYVIEIRNIDANGKMDAGYYNPRPIHVSKAEASWAGNDTKVFIELQDAGYPGSTYTLDYDTAKDVLMGYYYQAAVQRNFDVVFARMD